MDINVEIEVVLRAWNPGQGRGATNQALPFNPMELHDAVDARLRAVAEKNNWETRKPTVLQGPASKPPSWLNRPARMTTIRHACLGNLGG